MTTRAFVSYAHESDEHIAAVRRFVSFLRTQGGIDARYDLAAEHERPDWPVWMAEQTRLADFVLVVASRAYRERADRLVPHDEGRGVQYEAAIMRELSYQNRPGWRGKVLPVVLPGQSRDGIPDFLLPYSSTVYHVTSLTVAGAEPLLRVLLDRPRHVPERIGPAPVLAPVPTAAPLTEARYRRVRTRYAEEVADAWRSVRMDNLGDAGDPDRIVRLPLEGLHVALHADAEPDFQRARRLLGQRAADRGGDGGTVEERIGALVERGGKLRDATLAGTGDPAADAGVPLAEAVARHRVLVVRGAPGSGKTVLCQRLGAELAEELKRGGDRVPLRVRLADYAAAHADALAAGGAPGPLPEFVARSVPVPGASPEQVAAMLTAALERGRAVVLLDGLDEVGAHREALLEAVVEFDGRHPGNRLLVTSRVAGYAAAPLPLPDAAHYLIRPMAGPQIGAFVRNFFREVYADATRAEALLAELAEPHRAAALDLASTPLHLTSICLIWHRHGELPESRSGLYRMLVLDLAARWRSLVGPGQPPELRALLADEGHVLAMLAHVAATLHDHHPQGEITEGRLLDVVERALLGPAWYTRPAPERLGVELLEVLRTKVGVLNEIGTRTYAFSHLTVQEYLAGLTLVPESGEVTAAMLASMADRLGDPRWREPVALALDGLSPSARTVLLRVVARSAAEVDVWADVALSTGQAGDDAELAALAELAFTGCRALRDHPDLLADLVERVAGVRRKAGPARFDRLAMALPESLLPVVAAVYWRRRWLSDQVLTAFTGMSDSAEHAAWGRPVDRALRRAVSGPAPEIPLLDAPPRTGDVRLVELGLPAWRRARRERAEREVGAPLPGSLPLRDLFTGDPARWERCASDPRRAAALVVLLGGLDDRDAVAADARYGELADLLALPENPRTQAITESAATLVPHFGADDTVYETAVFLDTRSKKLVVRHAPEPVLEPRLATKPVGPTTTAALLAWALESPGDTGSLRDRLTGVAATGTSTERSEARLALAVLDGTPPPPDADRARGRALPWVADAAIRALRRWLGAAGGGLALLHLRALCAEVAGRPLDLPARAPSDAIARADDLGSALAQVDPDSRGSAPEVGRIGPDVLAWLPRLPTWPGPVRCSAAALSSDPAVAALDRLDVVAAFLQRVENRPGWTESVAPALLPALRPLDLSTPAGREAAHLAWRTGVATEAETADLAALALTDPVATPARFAPYRQESVLDDVDTLPPSTRLATYHYLARRALVPVSDAFLRRVAAVDHPDTPAVLLDIATDSPHWQLHALDHLTSPHDVDTGLRLAETLARCTALTPQARLRRAELAATLPTPLLRAHATGDHHAARTALLALAPDAPHPARVALTALIALAPNETRSAPPTSVSTVEPLIHINRGDPTADDFLAAVNLALTADSPTASAAILALLGPTHGVERPHRRYRLSHLGSRVWRTLATTAATTPTHFPLLRECLMQWHIDDPTAVTGILTEDETATRALLQTTTLWSADSQAALAAWLTTTPVPDALAHLAVGLAAMLTAAHGDTHLHPALREAVATRARSLPHPPVVLTGTPHTRNDRIATAAVVAEALRSTQRSSAASAHVAVPPSAPDPRGPQDTASTTRVEPHTAETFAAGCPTAAPSATTATVAPALRTPPLARAAFAAAAVPVFPATGPDRLPAYGGLHFQHLSTRPAHAAHWLPSDVDRPAALATLADWLTALDADGPLPGAFAPDEPHRLAEWDAVTSLLTVLADEHPTTVLTDWDPAHYQPVLSRAVTTVPSQLTRQACLALLAHLRYLDATPTDGPDLLAVITTALHSSSAAVQRAAEHLLATATHLRGASLVPELLHRVRTTAHETLAWGHARLAATIAAGPQCPAPDRRAVRALLRTGLDAPDRHLTFLTGVGADTDPLGIVRGNSLDSELRKLAR